MSDVLQNMYYIYMCLSRAGTYNIYSPMFIPLNGTS